MTIVVEWSDSRRLEVLKEKTEDVSFFVEKDFVDNSKSILAKILAYVMIFSSKSDHEPWIL